MKKHNLNLFLKIILLFIISPFISNSQHENFYSTSSIISKLNKLNTLGKVLYIAAHPDDENTRLIAYLSNEKKYETAYLSLTRGDGGQNLIGKDLKENLGVIRTQELLEARKIDGGIQFFSSAIDFGYSKNAEETLKFWNENKILYDIVWIIRKFKPDIIITRFNQISGTTHGHHTSSSILANKAFALSGDPEVFPDQLDKLNIWKPKRIFWNTSTRYFNISNYSEKEITKINVGLFNNFLGKSYNEISSESRSMHKSQGFGSLKRRGNENELFILTQGESIESDIMDGVDISWKRVNANKSIIENLYRAKEEFDPNYPERIVKFLLIAYSEIDKIKDKHWAIIKKNEIKNLIKACLGLYFESLSNVSIASIRDNINLQFDVINRSPSNIILEKIEVLNKVYSYNKQLFDNEFHTFSESIYLPDTLNFSEKYWLLEEPNYGNYKINNNNLIGNPDNHHAITSTFIFNINGTKLEYEAPIVNKSNNPTKGDDYKPFNIGLPIYLNPKLTNVLAINTDIKTVEVEIKSGKDKMNARIYLDIPDVIEFEPKYHDIYLDKKNQKKIIKFDLILPQKDYVKEKIIVKANINDKIYQRGIEEISYNHIPKQIRFPKSEISIIKFNLKIKGKNIAYIMGSGDNIPNSLSLIGYNVDIINIDDLNSNMLSKYDALIIGIRAYNINNQLTDKTNEILNFVKNGGNVIVQYNTSRGINSKNFAPYNFNISRKRVSQENSKVNILNPNHPALNYPNKIFLDDFNGWVQERGLYFPDSWSEEYSTLISSYDQGENPNDGGIILSKIGKGYYIYTSYSWFRQLPAGVKGAYKLFSNLISLGKEQ